MLPVLGRMIVIIKTVVSCCDVDTERAGGDTQDEMLPAEFLNFDIDTEKYTKDIHLESIKTLL